VCAPALAAWLAWQLLDAQELIVFRQPIRTAQRAGLDLPAIRRNPDVGDGRFQRFTGAMAEDGYAVVRLREFVRCPFHFTPEKKGRRRPYWLTIANRIESSWLPARFDLATGNRS